ncbi:MAG: dihydroorotase, partial [Gallionella sp.]|nr:dihydroorotase [Gallionella sp.]
MNIHIKNGRLIDPQNRVDAQQDLFIAAGKVVAIGSSPAGFVADETIDASGLIVAPGLIDLAARLREPGYEYKATLESEIEAAVAGGVTSLAYPPDTDPPLDEPGLVEMLKHRARNLHQTHVYPVGALTTALKGQELTEMAELADAGCVAFSQADAPLTDTRVLMRAMQYAATFGFSVWLRPQDSFLAKDGVAHDGEVATRCGLPAIPVSAETIALATMLTLARDTGVKLHVCRLSSAAGVEMIRIAKQQGLKVTCDVSMNHVHLSEMDIGFFDPNCHLIPPLRSLRDRAALRAGLLDGTIDAICSN